jgi:hypothetical protein
MRPAEIRTLYMLLCILHWSCVYLLQIQCCKFNSHMGIFLTGPCSLFIIIIIIIIIIKTYQMTVVDHKKICVLYHQYHHFFAIEQFLRNVRFYSNLFICILIFILLFMVC